MTDPNTEKQLDEMLDSLLANYSSVEPRPGLETRILASVREAEAQKMSRSWNFRWLGAAACVAVLALVMFVIFARRHAPSPHDLVSHGEKPVPQAPSVEPVTIPERSAAQRKQNAQPQFHVAHQERVEEDASLPVGRRPAIFPTPTPLSEQERLFFSYMRRTTREEIIAQSHPDEPLVDTEDQSGLAPGQINIPQRNSNTR